MTPTEHRDATIRRHVDLYLTVHGIDVMEFSRRVLRIYLGMAGDLNSSRHTLLGIANILDGRDLMPVDLEEAVILALPEDRQRRAWNDLAARTGRMSIAQPAEGSSTGLMVDCSHLMADAGHVLQRYSCLLADDGVVDENNSPASLKLSLESLRSLAATTHTLIHQVSEALARQGNEHLLQAGVVGINKRGAA